MSRVAECTTWTAISVEISLNIHRVSVIVHEYTVLQYKEDGIYYESEVVLGKKGFFLQRNIHTKCHRILSKKKLISKPDQTGQLIP